MDDVDDVGVVELKKKVILLEQDQAIKNFEINRLHEENKAQSRSIVELKSTISELSTNMIYLSRKLEAKFGSELYDKRETRVGESDMGTSYKPAEGAST